MSVVVVRGRSSKLDPVHVACDSRLSDSGKAMEGTKGEAMAAGGLVLGVGYAYALADVLSDLGKLAKITGPDIRESLLAATRRHKWGKVGGTSILWVRWGHKVRQFESDGCHGHYPISDHVAIGSGGDTAWGALARGAHTWEAVGVACARHLDCGPPAVTWTVREDGVRRG